MSMAQRKNKVCERCGEYIGKGDWWVIRIHSKKWVICGSCLQEFFGWIDRFGIAWEA